MTDNCVICGAEIELDAAECIDDEPVCSDCYANRQDVSHLEFINAEYAP